MTDRPHAQHRPTTDRDPAHAAPPTSFGWLYPEGDILAVVEDRSTGEQTLGDLRRAGVPEGDIDLLDAEWFLAAELAAEARRGPLQQLGAWLARAEGELAEAYRAEASRGHPILVVHAGDRTRVERIRGVLRGNGARWIRYYERYTIEDL
jgi:hypothetical protein